MRGRVQESEQMQSKLSRQNDLLKEQLRLVHAFSFGFGRFLYLRFG
jgi:hypothetical protein